MRVPNRLDHLDNLRAYLTFLVVAHHVALAYGTIPAWPNRQPPADPGAALPLDLFVVVNQAWFMGFFFLIAGFFTPASADRKGARAFARDRLARLGLPFLAYLVLLRPVYTLPTYLRLPDAQRPPYWRFYLTEADLGPMWFLEVLLLFTLVYAAWHARSGGAPAARTPLRARQVLAFAAGLAIASYLWRMLVPVGLYLPVVGLPSGAYLPQYVALFAVGVLGARRGWPDSLPRHAGRLGAGLIALSFVPLALGGFRGLSERPAPPVADPAHLGLAMWDSFLACGAILVLLVVFRRFAGRSTAVTRFASRNAFGVYLLHAPVIVLAVWAFSGLRAGPVATFLVVLPVCAVSSWVLSALLRRFRVSNFQPGLGGARRAEVDGPGAPG